MRWEDERYVRVYTRDTVDWLALSWDAQALLMQLLRKVDRAGLLPLGRHGARGVAVAIGHPGLWSRIEPALEELVADGCIEIRAGVLLFRNFIAAQETPQSDKQRKAESRARAADVAAAADVTKRDDASRNVTDGHKTGQNVTSGHAESHDVTSGHSVPYRAVPNRTVPDLPPPSSAAPREELLLEPKKPPRRVTKPKPDKPTDPRHAPITKELCEVHGWPHHGGRTARAVTELLALADQNPSTAGAEAVWEINRRATLAKASEGYPRVRELHELVTHWGHFAEPPRRAQAPPDGLGPAPPDACAGCGARGQGGSVGEPEVWLVYECGCLPAFTEAQSKGLHFTKAAEWAAKRRAA